MINSHKCEVNVHVPDLDPLVDSSLAEFGISSGSLVGWLVVRKRELVLCCCDTSWVILQVLEHLYLLTGMWDTIWRLESSISSA